MRLSSGRLQSSRNCSRIVLTPVRAGSSSISNRVGPNCAGCGTMAAVSCAMNCRWRCRGTPRVKSPASRTLRRLPRWVFAARLCRASHQYRACVSCHVIVTPIRHGQSRPTAVSRRLSNQPPIRAARRSRFGICSITPRRDGDFSKLNGRNSVIFRRLRKKLP